MSGKLVEGPVDLDVYVIDQNDNRPIFREPRYFGEVLEGSPTGTDHLSHTLPPCCCEVGLNSTEKCGGDDLSV